jgi:hypothetical protein
VGTDATGCYPADMSPTALNCIPSLAGNSQFAPAPVWDFTVDYTYGTLIVTDAFLYGDSFDVYDDAVLIFSTPNVPYTGTGCGSNPVDCIGTSATAPLNGGYASWASIVLSPGPQFIAIVPNALANGMAGGYAGAGYFELVNTPEPNELPILLLVSVCAMWLAFRRQFRRA